MAFTSIKKFLSKRLKNNSNDDGFSKGDSSWGGGMWWESAYIPKVELTEFADGSGIGREGKIARFLI